MKKHIGAYNSEEAQQEWLERTAETGKGEKMNPKKERRFIIARYKCLSPLDFYTAKRIAHATGRVFAILRKLKNKQVNSCLDKWNIHTFLTGGYTIRYPKGVRQVYSKELNDLIKKYKIKRKL